MANSTGLQFTLTLDGADEDTDLAVIEFTLDEALSVPFTLSVQFASRNGELDPADFLDRNAALIVWQDGAERRRVNGVVSEFACGDTGHRRTFYEVVIRPAFWRLGLNQNSRIFQSATPSAIIQRLCEENGLTDVAFGITRELPAREYVVQYRESDRAFIERLAAEEGVFYFHQFEGDRHELIFSDDPQLLPTLGERTYHQRAGGTPSQRHLRKLRQVSRVKPAHAMLRDYTFKNPTYDQQHDYLAKELEQHSQRDTYLHYDYPGRYKADASGEPFTRIRLESLRREALTAVAEGDLPELRPGVRFTLLGHDLERHNRDWQVVGVVHQGTQPQALEEDAGEGMTTFHSKELVLIPGDRAWRPEPTPKPRVDGPQVATVVGPDGEEIYTDEYGRVRVLFLWNREGTASAWLRVAQGWAGGGYGMFALPRVGHSVLVDFLEGDMDQPLITGSVYHAVNTPPYPLPANKTRTVIRTQTHQGDGFNELRFEDAHGEEQVWLHAQKDLETLVQHDRTEEIKHDSHLKVHHERRDEILGDDHHRVNGQYRQQVGGEAHRIVDGTGHERYGRALKVAAGRDIVLEAGTSVTLKAGGGWIRIDGNGVTHGPAFHQSSGSDGATGQAAMAALRPGEATAEEHEALPLPDQLPMDPVTPLCGKLSDTECQRGANCRCLNG